MLRQKLQLLKEKWKLDGVKICDPKSEEEILRSFLKIDKLISQDVLDFYMTIGGMDENEIDEDYICFWSVDQLVKENLHYGSDLASFADFLIQSHFWGFKYENPKFSSVYIDDYGKIADSVEEFLDLYLDKPDKIFSKK